MRLVERDHFHICAGWQLARAIAGRGRNRDDFAGRFFLIVHLVFLVPICHIYMALRNRIEGLSYVCLKLKNYAPEAPQHGPKMHRVKALQTTDANAAALTRC